MTTPGYDADVIVVGYGPVGVVAANHLGRDGVSTIVVERDTAIYPRARAVTVNDWTMRNFQSLDLDAAVSADMEINGPLNWKTYDGRTVFRAHPTSAGIGHPASMMIYQPAMEQTLREGVTRFPDSVQVRFGQQVTALEQDRDGVTVTVTDAEGSGEHTLRARYVLACDGGSSRVRQGLGVRLEGSTHETRWIVIDAEVLRWWPGCKELIFWSDPKRPVVDIPLAHGIHRWELPLRDTETEADFDTPESLWELLAPLGVSQQHVRIKQHAFYVHHVRHAERWRVGRVLLLGDAAHLMPPWAGQGMQSGIRDAQNATWKVREVLAGHLEESVLDTYEAERAPQVAEVTELSRRLGTLIAGTDPRFILLRNHLGPLLMRLTRLTNRVLSSGLPSVSAGWLTGVPGSASAVGTMIPQPAMATASGLPIRLDDRLGTGFAVVGMDVDPGAVLSQRQRDAWATLGARFVTVRSPAESAVDTADVIDRTGTLGAWFAANRTRVVALRPDRFVAASEPSGLDTPTPAAAGTEVR